MNNFNFLPDDIQITLDLFEPGILAFTEVRTVTLSKTEFIDFIEKNKASIAGNGVVYHNKQVGLIPSILNTWFNERLEYKTKLKEFKPDSPDYEYFDRKQLITKILLNSFYGVLLLPSFRFYDKQNGEGVTLSGQDIIKFSGSVINKYYKNKLNIENSADFVTYSDTDSTYIEAIPLIDDYETLNDSEIYPKIVEISNSVCEYANQSLKWLAENHFNSNNCRLKFAQEKIAKRAFWGTAKKRYAQLTLDKNLNEKTDFKGFDMVRSSFPLTFRKIQKELIIDILHDVNSTELNIKIKNFKKQFKSESIRDILLPTSVKEISKFKYGQKGTPIHVKSAQNYNKLLELFKIENLPKIEDGDKILWAYLKANPYGFETLAIRGYDDPNQIVEFLERFIDKNEIFNRSLMSKLETIWEDLGWGKINLDADSDFF